MNLITVNSSLLTVGKEGIRSIAMDMVNRVQDGEINAIDALIYVKKAVELFGEAEKNLRPLAESQYHLAKGEKQIVHSVEITEAETGVRYDYAACDDLVWNQLNMKAQVLDNQKKEREAFLKTVSRTMITGDSETGESWEIHPPIRSGKMGLKLSIK
jgi:hypothetical protein